MTLADLARRIKMLPAPVGFEEVTARLARECELLTIPLDLPGLVASRKLRRLSATRYRVLVPLADLPDHLTAQAVGVERDDGGPVLTFDHKALRLSRR